MKNDPAIEAIRQARREISRELGNDPARLIAHYMERQAHFRGRIIQGPEDAGPTEDAAQLAAAADKRVRAP